MTVCPPMSVSLTVRVIVMANVARCPRRRMKAQA